MTKASRLIYIILLCALGSVSDAGAQQQMLPPVGQTDSTATISLLTCAPGSDIYELEGHTGLRLQYGNGVDIVANWGLFDFNSPGFVYRFVKGETDYAVGAIPTNYFLASYRAAGRDVVEQILNLTPDQAVELIGLVEENLKPENRIYRYNYVKDNCATRPLRLIERAIGSEIEIDTTAIETTFRKEMQRFHANYPWYQFGIDIALGSGLDRPISHQETMFAPVTLQQRLENASIIGSDNQQIRAVKETKTLVDNNGFSPVEPATPWYATPMAIMTVLFAAAVIATFFDQRRLRISKWFDALLFSIIGVCGLIVAFLVFISTHEASSPNWLLLWLSPLALTVPLLQWWRKCRPIVKIYHIYDVIAITILTFIFISGQQHANPAFYPAMAATLIRSLNYLQLNYKIEKERKK